MLEPSMTTGYHNRAIGKVAGTRPPENPIGRAHQSTATPQTLGLQHLVQVRCQQAPPRGRGQADGVTVTPILLASTQTAGSMARRQRDRVIQKEERGPASRPRQRPPPVLEPGLTDDPKRRTVVSDNILVIVDDTATVTGEQSTATGSVQISPRVDTVAPGHGSHHRSPRRNRHVPFVVGQIDQSRTLSQAPIVSDTSSAASHCTK